MKREGTMLVETSWSEPPKRIVFEKHADWGPYEPKLSCEGCAYNDNVTHLYHCEGCSRDPLQTDKFTTRVVE